MGCIVLERQTRGMSCNKFNCGLYIENYVIMSCFTNNCKTYPYRTPFYYEVISLSQINVDYQNREIFLCVFQ